MADEATHADEALTAIRHLVADAQATQTETESFLALHTDDATVVNLAGRRVLGRDALRAAMEQALTTPLRHVITTADIDDIRFLRPDVAVVSCTKHVDDRRENADDGGSWSFPSDARLTYVMVRDGDDWRITLAQTTPIATA